MVIRIGMLVSVSESIISHKLQTQANICFNYATQDDPSVLTVFVLLVYATQSHKSVLIMGRICSSNKLSGYSLLPPVYQASVSLESAGTSKTISRSQLPCPSESLRLLEDGLWWSTESYVRQLLCW